MDGWMDDRRYQHTLSLLKWLIKCFQNTPLALNTTALDQDLRVRDILSFVHPLDVGI